MKCGNRQKLINRIAEHLLEEELLNEADAYSADAMMAAVSRIIEHELEDYMIVHGNLLE